MKKQARKKLEAFIHLTAKEPIRLIDVADQLNISPSNARMTLRKMVDAGFVTHLQRDGKYSTNEEQKKKFFAEEPPAPPQVERPKEKARRDPLVAALFGEFGTATPFY